MICYQVKTSGVFASLIVIGLLLIPLSHAQIDPGTVVAAWLFDGNTKDASGNGNDGDEVGGVKYVEGKFGKAIEFNGTDAWMTTPALGSFDKITILEWVKTTGRVGAWRVLINVDGWKSGDIHHQLAPDNRVEFSIHSNPGGNDTFATFAFDASQTNEWHHVATVYSSTEAKIRYYIDGELDNELAWGGNPGILDPGRVGSWSGGGREWQGLMDDFIIFNVALEEADIRDLMEKGFQGETSVESSGKLATSWGHIKSDY